MDVFGNNNAINIRESAIVVVTLNRASTRKGTKDPTRFKFEISGIPLVTIESLFRDSTQLQIVNSKMCMCLL